MGHQRDQPSVALNLDSDTARLHELGYKQELKRQLSMVSNFAFSFSTISVLAGITITFNTGLRYGGPFSATIGWLVVSVFNVFVALSMAEICSAYPTSGGLYYWSARLAGKEWAPFAAWITGWFNLVGQWAGTASGEFAFAQLLQVMILLSTGGTNGGGYLASKYVVLCFHGGVLLIHGFINNLPISSLSVISRLGAIWNVIGIFVLMILIPAVATKKASIEFVFTHFNTENDAGIHSKVYIFVIGLLMSQYSVAGYDTSAHLTEETKNADKSPALGIIAAVAVSGFVGWAYLIGIMFAVRDIPYLLSSENEAAGNAIAEIFYLAFKSRYGNGVGGTLCLGVVAVALFFACISSLTSNSRLAYAFSRDGAMPLSSVWYRVNKQEVPTNAVWLSVFVAFCMALTSLGSLVAFQAMASIATIALYIAYGLPIFFRVTLGRMSFVQGPFSLGRYSVLISWLAVLWIVTISILFSLPVSYPITVATLNYTPIALGAIIILTFSSWFLSARHWFKGPIRNIEVEL